MRSVSCSCLFTRSSLEFRDWAVLSAPVCFPAKDTALCHRSAAQNIHYHLWYPFIDHLLYSRSTPDTEEHRENR